MCFTEKVIKAYGELGGDLHLVAVNRAGGNGLGLSLVGNRDLNTMSVFVVGIQPNSTTANDGRIHVGDELLEVSGVDTRLVYMEQGYDMDPNYYSHLGFEKYLYYNTHCDKIIRPDYNEHLDYIMQLSQNDILMTHLRYNTDPE